MSQPLRSYFGRARDIGRTPWPVRPDAHRATVLSVRSTAHERARQSAGIRAAATGTDAAILLTNLKVPR